MTAIGRRVGRPYTLAISARGYASPDGRDSAIADKIERPGRTSMRSVAAGWHKPQRPKARRRTDGGPLRYFHSLGANPSL